MAQNEAKDPPKRVQEAPERPKKVIPNRKTKKGPNQDDPKTVLDRQGSITTSSAAPTTSSAAPPGLHLGGPNGTKIDPKTIKNRIENSR